MTEPDPPLDETVVLVDADGTVAGTAARSAVRLGNLRHASTAVLVRNSAGEVYLHRRAPTKDWAPGHHDAAAGGMLRPGEDAAGSARRELAEELGIDVGVDALVPRGLSAYDDATVAVVEHVFEVVWDGPVTFADGEVVAGAWVSLADLAGRLADPSYAFVPDTRALLRRLADDGVGDWGHLRVVDAARAAGLSFTVTRHGQVRSLEEAAAARGVRPAAIVKSLVVRLADDDYRFVLVPGDRQISWPLLREALGVSRASMPTTATAYDVTGFRRGAITPLGSRRPWPVLVDASIGGQVSLGAGAPGVALTVESDELVRAVDARVGAFTALPAT